jgi:hypothetical protein
MRLYMAELNVFQQVFASVDKRTRRLVNATQCHSRKQPPSAKLTAEPEPPTCPVAKEHRQTPKPKPDRRIRRTDDDDKRNSDVDEAVALIEELEAMLRDKADVAENGRLALAAAQERHERLEQRRRDLELEIQMLDKAIAGRTEMCQKQNRSSEEDCDVMWGGRTSELTAEFDDMLGRDS